MSRLVTYAGSFLAATGSILLFALSDNAWVNIYGPRYQPVSFQVVVLIGFLTFVLGLGLTVASSFRQKTIRKDLLTFASILFLVLGGYEMFVAADYYVNPSRIGCFVAVQPGIIPHCDIFGMFVRPRLEEAFRLSLSAVQSGSQVEMFEGHFRYEIFVKFLRTSLNSNQSV